MGNRYYNFLSLIPGCTSEVRQTDSAYHTYQRSRFCRNWKTFSLSFWTDPTILLTVAPSWFLGQSRLDPQWILKETNLKKDNMGIEKWNIFL